MFRNPRDAASFVVDKDVFPSVGRPPTPPPHAPRFSGSNSSPHFASTMSTASNSPQMALLGRQPAGRIGSVKKPGMKQNQSILNFFGKAAKTEAESNTQESRLFFEDPTKQESPTRRVDPPAPRGARRLGDNLVRETEDTATRYNEIETPVKKRKLSTDSFDLAVRTPSPEFDTLRELQAPSSKQVQQKEKPAGSPPKQIRHRGGFIDDSDEDSDGDIVNISDSPTASGKTLLNRQQGLGPTRPASGGWEDTTSPGSKDITSLTLPSNPLGYMTGEGDDPNVHGKENVPAVPTLCREETSMFIPGDFEDLEDFENDEFFEGGEELMERRWMEEQREMEMAFDEDEDSKSESDGSAMTPRNEENLNLESMEIAEAACPICNGSLRGSSEAQASSHVNACLDGKAGPLPLRGNLSEDQTQKGQSSTSSHLPASEKSASGRFKRAAIARPAQANPFGSVKDGRSGNTSAFTRLMSGHAEDAAWVEAAANENQSRGKPAYQRTCPFYKIMPGLYICVDAFRYGKVEGQNAYFLSHFHSDHYIGLTSSWCHGPIYASKVTTNLIRQQLRVDEKWLVPLEFEKKVEVPHTNGVFVTMIPANHCPGSSLYLFEKVLGKNRDGSARMNRILHCGDFRACPAHVAHPLLQPDVADAITGQTKQQVIDTCYLDTTYLTPKYAFPSQYDVIDACAQMCVSLSKEIVDSEDSWEQVKAERAGNAMKNFLESRESVIKEEDEDDSTDKKPQLRGRLLVVIGTYSIGKERICLGIAKALGSKIYAPPAKMRICACLEDEELNALLTKNPLEAQVHMQTLMEIRAETLHDYLVTYKGHFSRVVGFRPTGWSYRPPTSRFTENPAVPNVLHSEVWKSRFTMRDLVPQRGSTKESHCFGVPYSEHSSFRELTMFCCALRIGKVIPTVNVGSAKSREKMKGWIEKWDTEKKKNGLFKVEVGAAGWGSGDGKLRYGV